MTAVVSRICYIRYNGLDFGTITLGQFKQEFGLDQMISSKYRTFIERAMVSTYFTPGRRIGVGLTGNRERLALRVVRVRSARVGSSEGINEGNGARRPCGLWSEGW